VTAEPDLGDARFGGAGMIGSGILRTSTAMLGPVMILASLWLLVRGHGAVGGGFIGGLVAGAAVVLRYLSHGHADVFHRRTTRTVPTVAIGVLIAAAYGLAGLVADRRVPRRRQAPLPVVGEVAASLVFDIGVYVVVVGLVAAIMRHLGQGVGAHELPAPTRTTTRPHGRRRPDPVGTDADDTPLTGRPRRDGGAP
jgi:multisubunit Na+/H+ antiporter MnhB subunit